MVDEQIKLEINGEKKMKRLTNRADIIVEIQWNQPKLNQANLFSEIQSCARSQVYSNVLKIVFLSPHEKHKYT